MKIKAIEKAQDILNNSYYDIYHSREHHSSVATLSLEIHFAESIKDDTDALEISAWWHDIYKGKDENALIAESLTELGIDENLINEVTQIVGQHSFGQEQTTNQSKILYDADKIELVSIARWKYAFDAYSEGIISLEERDKYIPEWNKRMPLLEGNLHFNYSNMLFTKRYQLFIQWLKQIGRYSNGSFV